MKLKKSNLLSISLIILGLSFLPVVLSSCSGTSNEQAAQRITQTNLVFDFAKKTPLEVKQRYALSVTDLSGEILSSQIFECNDLKACAVTLENINLSQTGFVYVRIFNGQGGLVAASLMNASQFVSGGELNGNKVVFSEYTTGVYILAKMQQISDTMYDMYNGKIVDDFQERFHLEKVEKPEYLIPMVAYQFATQLGLHDSEADGVYRLWFNIYGDSDEYDDVSVSMINQSAAHMYKPSSNISKASNNKMPAIVEADEDKEDDNTNTNGVNQLRNARKKLLTDINSIGNSNVTDTGIVSAGGLNNQQAVQQQIDKVLPKKEDEKSKFVWITDAQATTVAQMYGKYLGKTRPPVSSEERKTAEIISSALGNVFKTVNLYAPGLGTVLNMINTAGLEALFPVKNTNPNAAIEEKLDLINTTLSNSIKVTEKRFDTADKNRWTDLDKARAEMYNDIKIHTQNYFSILSTVEGMGVNVTAITEIYGYPALLDVYMDKANDHTQAIDMVKSMFSSDTKAKDVVKYADNVSSKVAINQYMEALNNVRDNAIRVVSENPGGSKNYVTIDEEYYLQILSATTATLKALEQLRNYQLAGAYLMLKSKFKNEIGTVYLSEFAGNLQDYATVTNAINRRYKEREDEVSKAFADATKKSNVYKDTERWGRGIIRQDSTDNSKPCFVRYWDGADLSVSCPSKGVNGSTLSTVIYDIANKCKEILTLDGNRVYCNVKVEPGIAYLPLDKFMKASNYSTEEEWRWLSLGYEVVSMYNNMYVQNSFSTNDSFRNVKGVDYRGKEGNNDLYRISLIRDGLITDTHSYQAGKPMVNRYVSYDSHKVWVLSSYNTLIIGGGAYGSSSSGYTPLFSLGCFTSDCVIYKNPKGVTELYYPDVSYYFTMEVVNPSNDKSFVNLKVHPLTDKDSAGLPKIPAPYGDWATQCNISTMTYQNDILTAVCTDGAWNPSPTSTQVEYKDLSLNYKKDCKMGSYVTFDNKTHTLQCVEPREKKK